MEDAQKSLLQFLEEDLARTERQAMALRAAISSYAGDHPEALRWQRNNGKPMRPIEVMEILLREHGGELPTGELYEKLVEGGAFRHKANPESAFRLSIQINIRNKRITQTDAEGRNIKDIDFSGPPFPGVTRLTK
jgi:hypothetical protein